MTCYSTIHGSSADVIKAIMRLHTRAFGKAKLSVLDATYRKGTFWTKTFNKRIRLVACDRFPQKYLDMRCDMTALPFRPFSFHVAVIDPPFANSSTTPRTDPLSDVYNLGSVLTPKEIWRLYSEGIREAFRVLLPSGILVVKCQPFIDSGKQHWIDHDILMEAEKTGFYALDRFWLIPDALPRMRHTTRQHHARKWGSVFWVFQTPRRKMHRASLVEK